MSSQNPNISRPVAHLNAAGRLYPRAWHWVEKFRADRGKGGIPDWPGWCFLPVSAWYAMVSEPFGGQKVPPGHVEDVGRLAAVGTWRYSQGIYRFDPALFAALIKTDLTGDMPGEVLLRLPEWCVYIETPGMEFVPGDRLYGFFAHLEHDAHNGRRELRLLLDCSSGLLPVPVHVGPWPLVGGVHRMLSESVLQAAVSGAPAKIPSTEAEQEAARFLAPLLSLLLYLCSDEPEIGAPGEGRPQRPRPTRVKGGWRLFPAKGPRVWPVGEALGRSLREALERDDSGLERDDSERKSPRFHLRRAHWHGYWTGPKDGERRFRYKWLPPTAVGGKESANDHDE